MARPSNADLRRRQIAAALARLLPITGFRGASTKAIAMEAGLSAGLVHHHFNSKLEILVAVVEDLAAALTSRVPVGPLAPRERIHAQIDAWLAPGEGAAPSAVACWAAIGAEAVRHEAVARVYQSAVTAQIDALSEALQAAAPHRSADQAQALAAMIQATIEGSFRLHVSAPGAIPDGRAAPSLRAMVDAWLEAR